MDRGGPGGGGVAGRRLVRVSRRGMYTPIRKAGGDTTHRSTTTMAEAHNFGKQFPAGTHETRVATAMVKDGNILVKFKGIEENARQAEIWRAFPVDSEDRMERHRAELGWQSLLKAAGMEGMEASRTDLCENLKGKRAQIQVKANEKTQRPYVRQIHAQDTEHKKEGPVEGKIRDVAWEDRNGDTVLKVGFEGEDLTPLRMTLAVANEKDAWKVERGTLTFNALHRAVGKPAVAARQAVAGEAGADPEQNLAGASVQIESVKGKSGFTEYLSFAGTQEGARKEQTWEGMKKGMGSGVDPMEAKQAAEAAKGNGQAPATVAAQPAAGEAQGVSLQALVERGLRRLEGYAKLDLLPNVLASEPELRRGLAEFGKRENARWIDPSQSAQAGPAMAQ